MNDPLLEDDFDFDLDFNIDNYANNFEQGNFTASTFDDGYVMNANGTIVSSSPSLKMGQQLFGIDKFGISAINSTKESSFAPSRVRVICPDPENTNTLIRGEITLTSAVKIATILGGHRNISLAPFYETLSNGSTYLQNAGDLGYPDGYCVKIMGQTSIFTHFIWDNNGICHRNHSQACSANNIDVDNIDDESFKSHRRAAIALGLPKEWTVSGSKSSYKYLHPNGKDCYQNEKIVKAVAGICYPNDLLLGLFRTWIRLCGAKWSTVTEFLEVWAKGNYDFSFGGAKWYNSFKLGTRGLHVDKLEMITKFFKSNALRDYFVSNQHEWTDEAADEFDVTDVKIKAALDKAEAKRVAAAEKKKKKKKAEAGQQKSPPELPPVASQPAAAATAAVAGINFEAFAKETEAATAEAVAGNEKKKASKKKKALKGSGLKPAEEQAEKKKKKKKAEAGQQKSPPELPPMTTQPAAAATAAVAASHPAAYRDRAAYHSRYRDGKKRKFGQFLSLADTLADNGADEFESITGTTYSSSYEAMPSSVEHGNMGVASQPTSLIFEAPPAAAPQPSVHTEDRYEVDDDSIEKVPV